jgi:DNA-binding transcriptional regulator YiaG
MKPPPPSNLNDLTALLRARRLATSGEAKRLRQRSALTQGELAAALGVATSTVCRWERGERQPSGMAGARYGYALTALVAEEALG